MQTITKRIPIIIDVMPLEAPDHQPLFILNAGPWAPARLEGYHRFRVEIDIPVPVQEYTQLPIAVAKPEEASNGADTD